MRWLYGWWRFSDYKIVRLVSRLLCRPFGRHAWIIYDGRPVNCGVCGLLGHPIAYRQLKGLIDDAIERRREDGDV